MRLRRPCDHGNYDMHRFSPNEDRYYETCPGGEFLPEDAIVIEKVDGRWPSHLLVRAGSVLFERGGYVGIPNSALYDDVGAAFDTLAADQIGEPG